MKKRDQLDRLMDYIGRCYKTTMDDTTAYSQVSGIITEDGAPAQEPLEITHIIRDPQRVIFRRGRLAPEDLAPGMIGQEEITAEEYAEELRGVLSAYRPIDAPSKADRTAMRRAIRGTP